MIHVTLAISEFVALMLGALLAAAGWFFASVLLGAVALWGGWQWLRRR